RPSSRWSRLAVNSCARMASSPRLARKQPVMICASARRPRLPRYRPSPRPVDRGAARPDSGGHANGRFRHLVASRPRLRCEERRRPRAGHGRDRAHHPSLGPAARPAGRGDLPERRRRLSCSRSVRRRGDSRPGALCHPFLAAPRCGSPHAAAPRPFRARSRCRGEPRRLSHNAGHCFMVGPASAPRRNMAPPEKTAPDRQLSVLAEMVALIAPADAERIAASLLAEFQTIGRIWSRTPQDIDRITGAGSEVTKLLLRSRKLALEALSSGLQGIKIDPCCAALRDYLVLGMGSLADERLRVLFLDAGGHLIADEQLQHGTLTRLALY